MAKKPKVRFSGYYPATVVQAIKAKAEKEEISENEAATQLIEAGIKALQYKLGSYQTEPGPTKQADQPKGLKGVALAIWKAEQKEKK